MPFAQFSCPVSAPVDVIWSVLLDKASNPGNFVPGISGVEVVESYDDGFLRKMYRQGTVLTEKIVIDRPRLRIDFILVDHADYTGRVVNHITPAKTKSDFVEAGEDPMLTFKLDWPKRPGRHPENDHMQPAIQAAVLSTARVAVDRFHERNS